MNKRFPDSAYKSIGAFSFLRLFSACVTTPHVFGVLPEPPREKTQRYLILMSKTLTCTANNTIPGQKEPFMAEIKEFIVENQGRLKTFFEEILVRTFSKDFDFMLQKSPPCEAAPTYDISDLRDNALCLLHNVLAENVSKLKNLVSSQTFQNTTALLEKMGEPASVKK